MSEVLIVSNNKDDLRSLEILLGNDLLIRTANDKSDALWKITQSNFLQEKRIGVVLADLRIPDFTSGEKFINTIKHRFMHINVIAMTDEISMENFCLENQISFVRKPLTDINKLCQKIKLALA